MGGSAAGGLDPPPADDVRILLFQAVRELISNAVKHASPASIRVSVAQRRGREWSVTVEDNGDGFDAERHDAQHVAPKPNANSANGNAGGSAGFGLFNVRTRVEQIGGRLELRSTPGVGTKVHLSAPTSLV